MRWIQPDDRLRVGPELARSKLCSMIRVAGDAVNARGVTVFHLLAMARRKGIGGGKTRLPNARVAACPWDAVGERHADPGSHRAHPSVAQRVAHRVTRHRDRRRNSHLTAPFREPLDASLLNEHPRSRAVGRASWRRTGDAALDDTTGTSSRRPKARSTPSAAGAGSAIGTGTNRRRTSGVCPPAPCRHEDHRVDLKVVALRR